MTKPIAIAIFAALALLASATAHAADPAPAKIFVVRHAQAWKNMPASARPAGMTTAQLDSLTPKGLEQATEVGRKLAGRGIVAVYASPAQRAQQTAERIGKELGLTPVTDDAFRPLDTGTDARAASGTTRARNWESGKDPRPPGGESLADGWKRASDAVAAIAAKHAGAAVVVVTHGEIASSLLTRAAGEELLAGYFDHFPAEASIHELKP
jgi:broad specificity phosphatase PhoE